MGVMEIEVDSVLCSLYEWRCLLVEVMLVGFECIITCDEFPRPDMSCVPLSWLSASRVCEDARECLKVRICAY